MGPFQFWKRMRDSSPAIFSGDTVPTDASSGYPIGSIFVQTDGVAGTCLYVNEGTATSCDFNAVVTGAGGATVAASQTLAVTTADLLTIGGIIAPQHIELAFKLSPFATVTEYDLWVAPAAYQVTAINVVPSTLQGGALTATVVKAVSTATPVKTTTPMHTADAIDLNAGAYTVQPITLTATTADLQLAAGNRISIDYSAAYTVGHAALSIRLKRI